MVKQTHNNTVGIDVLVFPAGVCYVRVAQSKVALGKPLNLRDYFEPKTRVPKPSLILEKGREERSILQKCADGRWKADSKF